MQAVAPPGADRFLELLEQAYLDASSLSIRLAQLKVYIPKMQFQRGEALRAVGARADKLAEEITVLRNRLKPDPEKVLTHRPEIDVEARARLTKVRRQKAIAYARTFRDMKNHTWRKDDEAGLALYRAKQEVKE